MLRPLIHFNLSFVQGDKNGSICIFYMPLITVLLVEDAFFFPLHSLGFIEKRSSVHMCEFISGSSILFYWLDLSPFLCTNTLQFLSPLLCSKLEGMDRDSPGSSFIIENCFHYLLLLLLFPMKMRIAISISLKQSEWLRLKTSGDSRCGVRGTLLHC